MEDLGKKEVIGEVGLSMIGPGHPDYEQAVADLAASRQRWEGVEPAPPVDEVPVTGSES